MPVTVMMPMISVGGPVQRHVEGAEPHLRGDRHHHHARLLQRVAVRERRAPRVDRVGRSAEEQRQAGKEVPGPDLALRQDRIEPARDRRVERIGGDADAGEQADDERDRGHPVQHKGADVAARGLIARLAALRCRAPRISRARCLRRASVDHGQRCPPCSSPMVAEHQSWPPAAQMVNGIRKLLTKKRDALLEVVCDRRAIRRIGPPAALSIPIFTNR